MTDGFEDATGSLGSEWVLVGPIRHPRTGEVVRFLRDLDRAEAVAELLASLGPTNVLDILLDRLSADRPDGCQYEDVERLIDRLGLDEPSQAEIDSD
jgi:hypothetical protein